LRSRAHVLFVSPRLWRGPNVLGDALVDLIEARRPVVNLPASPCLKTAPPAPVQVVLLRSPCGLAGPGERYDRRRSTVRALSNLGAMTEWP
jgi:hypothetical protein